MARTKMGNSNMLLPRRLGGTCPVSTRRIPHSHTCLNQVMLRTRICLSSLLRVSEDVVDMSTSTMLTLTSTQLAAADTTRVAAVDAE